MANRRLRDIDHGWKALRNEIGRMGQKSVAEVGVLGDKATQEHEGGITNAHLATIHEFGVEWVDENGTHRIIVERSFLRANLSKNQAQYGVLAQKLFGLVIDGKIPIERALGILGAKVSADTQAFIANNEVQPPSSDATNEAKGSDTTLVDTGVLRASITWRVKA